MTVNAQGVFHEVEEHKVRSGRPRNRVRPPMFADFAFLDKAVQELFG